MSHFTVKSPGNIHPGVFILKIIQYSTGAPREKRVSKKQILFSHEFQQLM